MRNSLKACCAVVAMLGLGFCATVPNAGAVSPQSGNPTPGFYKMALGDFEITALSDGTIMLPVDKLLIGPPAEITELLHREFLESSSVETSMNAFLHQHGDKTDFGGQRRGKPVCPERRRSPAR